MLENFFQYGSLPADSMAGSYDPSLVFLSYLVATFASYIALDITSRLRDIRNTQTSITLWICGGAFAMGAGIWSMHFIGMLAFKMDMPMAYDPTLTLLSMVVAIGASAFALFLLKPRAINVTRIVLGGVVLGLAIAAMHYTGMAAMTNISIHYWPGLFFASILIAIIASEAALYLAIKSTQVIPKMRFRLKFVSAFVMGAAICGMHYTGMAAAVFTQNSNSVLTNSGGLDPQLMAISIAGVTTFILGIAFIVSTYKESLNQQLLMTARQAGMAEVAASVLHNVGNVLNSVNVSSTLISEKIQQSRLSGLNDLKNLIDQYKDNFDKFIQEDTRGKHLPEFLISLAQYWESEKTLLENETQSLKNNIEHIKKIIATQQDISRVNELEQMESVKDILDEAILICGVEDKKYNIHIKKNYERVNPTLVDKAKLLQILVNITQNAKDALTESKTDKKEIHFTISEKNSHYLIEIVDNGVGIPRDRLVRIFEYGFTTKKTGHGFGLHSSAITAKEMGGDLKARSEGENKGAIFTVILPYKTN